MIGESGSGKTTYAKNLVASDPDKYVRLERDELRIELAADPSSPMGRRFESHVAKVQKARAAEALRADKNVIISDTNLNVNTQLMWEEFANHKAAFRKYRIMTSLEDCIRNDAGRTGKSHVGRAVIERQFLLSKRLPLDCANPIVLVDVDGTVATFTDVNGNRLRSPYSLHVGVDLPFQSIIDEVNSLYAAGFTILIVSGRKSTCGDATIKWLDDKGVEFNHIFMRHGWDDRSDVIVKQEILNELLALISNKDLIEFVIDDRPRVVKGTWMANNIPVRPVYEGKFLTEEEFTTTHLDDCMYADQKDYRRCPNLKCNALEDF